MLTKSIVFAAILGLGMTLTASTVVAQDHQHSELSGAPSSTDTRQLVTLPEPMRQHTTANMRDHLLALQQIDVALAEGAFERAASIAEKRLGMSSLETHGAAHIAPYMPQAMQDIGTQMHRAASRFAVDAQTASMGNDLRPALASLGIVMQQCVACHAAYRLH